MLKTECVYCGERFSEKDSTAVEVNQYCSDFCENSDKDVDEEDRLS